MKQSAEERVEEQLVQDIFSGLYPIGEFLPPERVLAEALKVSRPVVHKALIRLEGKGLVTIVPRQGVRVNDYKVNGKLSLLESIFTMAKWKIDVNIQKAIMNYVKSHLIDVLISACSKDVAPHKENEYFSHPDDLFLWMRGYALETDHFIDTMLFNEFEVGIKNVAKFLLEKDLVEYQTHRIAIDFLVKKHKKDQIEQAVDAFFDGISIPWYEEVQR